MQTEEKKKKKKNKQLKKVTSVTHTVRAERMLGVRGFGGEEAALLFHVHIRSVVHLKMSPLRILRNVRTYTLAHAHAHAHTHMHTHTSTTIYTRSLAPAHKAHIRTQANEHISISTNT